MHFWHMMMIPHMWVDFCAEDQFSTLRMRQKGWHFVDDKFKCILFCFENVWLKNKTVLKCVTGFWLMINHNCLKLWLGTDRWQAITWTNDGSISLFHIHLIRTQCVILCDGYFMQITRQSIWWSRHSTGCINAYLHDIIIPLLCWYVLNIFS